jgi:HrpA-like RNA helicase
VLKVNWISFSFAYQSAGRAAQINRSSKEQIRLNVLKIKCISQNFTNQRAGQAGQTRTGRCYRLYAESGLLQYNGSASKTKGYISHRSYP